MTHLKIHSEGIQVMVKFMVTLDSHLTGTKVLWSRVSIAGKYGGKLCFLPIFCFRILCLEILLTGTELLALTLEDELLPEIHDA